MNYFPVHRQPARKKAKRWRDTELQTEFAGPKVENWQQAGITVPMDLRDELKELNAHERTDWNSARPGREKGAKLRRLKLADGVVINQQTLSKAERKAV